VNPAVPERLARAVEDRYRIERELGAGGMATVYLAHDLKHDRRVALKVLRPELAAVLGAERFVVEIRTTAALQHPHILPLFDSGEADGFLYYVMPFVDGETLRGRLDRDTQLSVEEATRLAAAIADALDYAHRQGVIHRDIKPENILLHDGRPVVADFGIALAVSAAAGGRMTETGLSLGTPHYMSPEQATAEREITARSDTYSLAAVLYEMLAGDPPHTGSSVQQIIMKIITEEPAPVTRLRKSVPPNVAAAIAVALEKLPADRFPSAAAFGAALLDPGFRSATHPAGHRGAAAAVHARAGGTWREWLRDPRSWGAPVAAAALASVAFYASAPRAVAPVGPATVRLHLVGPADSSVLSLRPRPGTSLGAPVVSPDGRYIAFAAETLTGNTVYLRALDSFDLVTVPRAGDWPLFAPDSRRLAFFHESDLWVMDLDGGRPVRVGTFPVSPWDIGGAAWHPDDRILATSERGLWALPASGGAVTLLLPSDSAAGERFREVDVLSDGRLLLSIERQGEPRIEVVSADGTRRRVLLRGASAARVVEDVLLYAEGGQLRASRFNLRRLRLEGRSIPISEHPLNRVGRSIAWVDGNGQDFEPVWVSRDGTDASTGIPKGLYRWPRISPDGGRVALGELTLLNPGRPGHDYTVQVRDLRRGTVTRLAGSTEPAWSADGRRVFTSGGVPLQGLVVQVADGALPPDTLLTASTGDAWPTDVSPDGRWLAFYGAAVDSGTSVHDAGDLMFLELATREVRRIRLPGVQRGGRFSPDGLWFAYQSLESGREEVHVRPWPGMDANHIISSDGGNEPLWSAGGREIFYRRLSEVFAVSFNPVGGSVERSSPRLLFTGGYSADRWGDQSWDMGPDGRFLMLRPVSGSRHEMRVALNWIADVRARIDRSQ
jgi:eukaryotic-like serine/threonine-protein kinase